MKKYLLTIVLSLIIGFFLGNFLIKQYKDYKGISVSKVGDEFYFVEYGVYSSLEEMESNTINLENYIYNIENKKYFVYVAITKDKNNLQKIQNYFKGLGYDTTVKSYFLTNKKFDKLVTNYDLIINKTNDNVAISSLVSQVLEKYQEVVNGNKN